MDLKKITSNCHSVNNGFGVYILFSYNVPVAIRIHGREYKTSKRWSNTTSKHVTAWCVSDAMPVDQNTLERLCREGDNFILNEGAI